MARTFAGQQLTEAYRRRQLALRAATLREVVRIWPAFDIEDIDGSWPPVEAGLLSLIEARRRVSTGLAANYFRAFRTAEGVPGSPEPRIADPPDRRLQVATLNLLGPIAAKKNIAARVPNPMDRTLTRLSGTVTRQVLDGGRRTLTESARADRRAQGWRRITDADPCDFCADIAAQGVVGADVDFPAHDHCSCTQEIAY